MTRVEQAIERPRALPAADRETAAESVLAVFEQYEHPPRLTDDQVEGVRRTQEGLRNGNVRLLTAAETEKMWRRLGA